MNSAMSPAQIEAHRKRKLEAAKAVRSNLESALNDVRARIVNASQARSLADPVMTNRLPNLKEHESKLEGQLAACIEKMQAEYGDLLAEKATPIKSAQDQEIDRLQSLVATLSARLDKCRCAAASQP